MLRSAARERAGLAGGGVGQRGTTAGRGAAFRGRGVSGRVGWPERLPASPSLASCPSPHRESPCPAGPSLPAGRMLTLSWSFTLLFPETAVGRGFVLSTQPFCGSLAPPQQGPHNSPVPRLTRSRPEAEAPEIGPNEPEARAQGSLSSGLRKAPLSPTGEERQVEKGGDPGWTQTSGAPGLRPLVSILCCGQRSLLESPLSLTGPLE